MSHRKEQNQRLFAEIERLQLEIMALNRDKKTMENQLEEANAEIEKLKLENSELAEFKKKTQEENIKKAIVGLWKEIDDTRQWSFKVEGNKFMQRWNDWEQYDVYTFGVEHLDGYTVTVEGDRIVERWNDGRKEWYMENDQLIEDWYRNNQFQFKSRYARIGAPS